VRAAFRALVLRSGVAIQAPRGVNGDAALHAAGIRPLDEQCSNQPRWCTLTSRLLRPYPACSPR
jgi:hypothetical protein